MRKEIKEEILDFIASFMDLHGYAPTYREIGIEVGKSSSTVSRYIEQLKTDGKITVIDQKPRTLTPLRRVALVEASEDSQHRVQLEVADGGVVCFDFSLEKTGTDGLAITFTGVLDASRLKGRVGRVVGCKLEMNE